MVIDKDQEKEEKGNCSMGTEFQFCKISSRDLLYNKVVNTTVLYT